MPFAAGFRQTDQQFGIKRKAIFPQSARHTPVVISQNHLRPALRVLATQAQPRVHQPAIAAMRDATPQTHRHSRRCRRSANAQHRLSRIGCRAKQADHFARRHAAIGIDKRMPRRIGHQGPSLANDRSLAAMRIRMMQNDLWINAQKIRKQGHQPLAFISGRSIIGDHPAKRQARRCKRRRKLRAECLKSRGIIPHGCHQHDFIAGIRHGAI